MKACQVALLVVGITVSALDAYAQQAAARGGGGRGAVAAAPVLGLQITESAPIEVTQVKNAPFAAHAVTEFTQTFGDGNRIERRYQSSVARDSRGRTRREEEIALIGPLAAVNAIAPRLVTIVDPESAVTYTLDEEQRVAYRGVPAVDKKRLDLSRLNDQLKKKNVATTGVGGRGAAVDLNTLKTTVDQLENAEQVGVQDLGTRTIEGVRAQGTRTTTTIAAGAIGNLQPIEIVSERWFSAELQMPILVTRRDPRNGDTTYRLTNILRGEQPETLFTVPPAYEVKDGNMKFLLLEKNKGQKVAAKAQKVQVAKVKKLESAKVKAAAKSKTLDASRAKKTAAASKQ